MQTALDKAQQALTLLEQAVTGAHSRRQAINDSAAKSAAVVADQQKTINDLTTKLAQAENALHALADKVSALTSNVAGIS